MRFSRAWRAGDKYARTLSRNLGIRFQNINEPFSLKLHVCARSDVSFLITARAKKITIRGKRRNNNSVRVGKLRLIFSRRSARVSARVPSRWQRLCVIHAVLRRRRIWQKSIQFRQTRVLFLGYKERKREIATRNGGRDGEEQDVENTRFEKINAPESMIIREDDVTWRKRDNKRPCSSSYFQVMSISLLSGSRRNSLVSFFILLILCYRNCNDTSAFCIFLYGVTI